MKYCIGSIICLLLMAGCNNTHSDLVEKRVAGTPVTMELPSEFFADPSIVGFRHTLSQATIMIASAPVSYAQALSDMGTEKLRAIGQSLLNTEDVTIHGLAGKLYKLAYQADGYNFVQWRLVLPQDKNILMVNGTFPADQEKKVSDLLKNVLLTTRLDSGWRPDANKLGFSIEPDSTFKLAKVEGHAVVYTGDGAWTNESMADYSLFCSYAPGSIDNKGEFTLENFSQFCEKCNLLGHDSLEVAGLKGNELWGTSTDSLGTHFKYEAILFDSTKYYVVLGTSAGKDEQKLNSFKYAVRHLRKE